MMALSAEHALSVVEQYAGAATESRVDDIAALFSETAELRDPYDGEAQQGREAIRAFFAAGVSMIDRLSVNGPIRVTSDARSAAAPMVAWLDMNGTKLEMDSIDVFYFDGDGLISAMHGFYGPTNVRPRA